MNFKIKIREDIHVILHRNSDNMGLSISSYLALIAYYQKKTNKMKNLDAELRNVKGRRQDFYFGESVIDVLNELSGFPKKNRTRFVCNLIVAYDGYFA